MKEKSPCRKCKSEENSERHHVYPKRNRKSLPQSKWHETVRLCHNCHLSLEKLLNVLEKHIGRLPDEAYHYLAYNY